MIPGMARGLQAGLRKFGPAAASFISKNTGRVMNQAGKLADNLPTPVAIRQAAPNYVKGFLEPGPFPWTKSGFLGYGTREALDRTGLTDAMVDQIPLVWEAYYKDSLNPNWRNDPTDIYYPHKNQPRKRFWTQPPSEPETPKLSDLIPDRYIYDPSVDPEATGTIYP